MIGLFDSGLGGLSILKSIREALPQYSYIYLGDHKTGPYGSLSPKNVYMHTASCVETLFSNGSKLVILACNTASAVALRQLQQEWLPKHYQRRRILGILVPTIEQITGMPWGDPSHSIIGERPVASLGILATPVTVASGAYKREIKKRAPQLRVYEQPCPSLAGSIEQGEARAIRTKAGVFTRRLIAKSQGKLDVILLGSTHYSLVYDVFLPLMPHGTVLFDQPGVVARTLTMYLKHHLELERSLDREGSVAYVTTGDAKKVSERAASLGYPVIFRNDT